MLTDTFLSSNGGPWLEPKGVETLILQTKYVTCVAAVRSRHDSRRKLGHRTPKTRVTSCLPRSPMSGRHDPDRQDKPAIRKLMFPQKVLSDASRTQMIQIQFMGEQNCDTSTDFERVIGEEAKRLIDHKLADSFEQSDTELWFLKGLSYASCKQMTHDCS